MYRPRTDWWNAARWTSLMTTEPLRKTLARRVDFDGLNASDIAFAVSAVDVESGEARYFTNRDGERVSLSTVVASGSLPPGFPMTVIEGRSYWDGGLFDNTPLQPALDMLDPDPAVRKRLIVVALFPRAGKVPTSFAEVADRMIDLQFADRMGADLARLREMKALTDVLRDLEADPKARLLAASSTLREAQEATYVHDIVEIVNEHPEVASGASDFSAPAIERRIAAGYADAAAALGEIERAA
jgi:predicted acylesterase/phospholipase RssA